VNIKNSSLSVLNFEVFSQVGKTLSPIPNGECDTIKLHGDATVIPGFKFTVWSRVEERSK